MSAADLRRKVKELHGRLGASRPSALRKNECERMIGIYEEILKRQEETPLKKESHHLPPREMGVEVKSEGIEVPVVPPKRPTQDRKKPTTAKDIVIVHESGDAEKVEVKPAHIKKEKVKVEKPVVAAEPVPEKKKRVMTEEHKAKMKAGRDALKAKKAAETGGVSPPAEPKASPKPTEPPAPVPSAKLPSGVRPLA